MERTVKGCGRCQNSEVKYYIDAARSAAIEGDWLRVEAMTKRILLICGNQITPQCPHIRQMRKSGNSEIF